MPFDATTSTPDHWTFDAARDLESLSASSPPALRRRLDAAFARLSTMNGARALRDALVRPASTPFVAAVDACASDLGLTGDARVALMGRATVALYAYVRVQDDLVDEPDRVDRAAVYAAEALLCEHLARFSEAVADPAAHAWRARIMGHFAGVAATEVDDRDGDASVADLGWMGEKFLPMAVPLVGLAVIAGRADAADSLVAFVREVGTALQLVNDAFNVAEDAAGGRTTPVLRWLREGDASIDASHARATLLSGAVMSRVVDEARRYADAATARAHEMEMPALAEVGRRAREMVDRAPDRLCRLMLGMSV
jgi:hypothetical protein